MGNPGRAAPGGWLMCRRTRGADSRSPLPGRERHGTGRRRGAPCRGAHRRRL